MGIITYYLDLQKEQQLKYGNRSVVLMQVGNFYEIYGFYPQYCTSEEAKIDDTGKKWDENVGHAINISIILNCVLTFEDSNMPYSIKSPHKLGFPTIAYEKNRDTLLANDYVIIRVDQEKTKNLKGPMTRYIAEVCSPTMQIDNIIQSKATSNIACVYIEYQQGIKNKFENFLITTGASVVDILTGSNRICEFYSKTDDQIHAIQELYRFLITHYPRELIIHISDMPIDLSKHTEDSPNPYVVYLERVLELRRFDRLSVFVNNVPVDYKKLSYQKEFLNKIFNNTLEKLDQNYLNKRNEKIIEELGLERITYGRISYILLMQHCYAHNTEIISKLSTPDLKWIDEDKHLILTHNAIVQLDIINNQNEKASKKKEIDSLISILDQTQTNLGKRALYNIIQNPMYDIKDIELHYNMIDDMLKNVGLQHSSINQSDLLKNTSKNDLSNGEPLWLILEKQLKELPDIARLQRKLEIKLITPKELAILFKTYIKIITLYINIMNYDVPTIHKNMLNQDEINSFNEFMNKYGLIVNFDALECCNINVSSESNDKYFDFVDYPIKTGVNKELDEKTKLLVEAENNLQMIVDHLNIFLGNAKGKKIEFRNAKKKPGARKQDPTNILLATSASKASALMNSPVDVSLCGKINILQYTTSDRIITSDKIEKLCNKIDTIRMELRTKLYNIYNDILDEMNEYKFYNGIISLIARLDLIHCYAKISYRNNYYRPTLIDGNGASYFEAQEMRHPIIEKIIDGAYVSNNISLGKNNNKNENENDNKSKDLSNGILLFGLNQSGKSSLIKSIALNIIMAQAGCFVPCKLTLKPYAKIITRLSSNDNLFKGQSSFCVEMTELRTILRQADERTLVIGDELCHGTETHSALCITLSTILSLIKSKTSFIFATHIHEILNLTALKNIEQDKLRICHLSVSYNEMNKALIYDRKLQNGSGQSIYGLLVAKSLDLPIEFIEQANNILLEITEQNENFVDMKTSKYNSKLYVDICAMCKKNKTQTQLQTHHILEQHTSDEKGNVIKLDGNGNKIGLMNVNTKNNLIILCAECHENLHSRKEEIEYLETSGGKIFIKK
jgi:DNA mismatch repair protein MutS